MGFFGPDTISPYTGAIKKHISGVRGGSGGVGGVIKVRFLGKLAILGCGSGSRGHIGPRLWYVSHNIINDDHYQHFGGVFPPDLPPRGSVGGVILRENALFSCFC